MLKHKSHDTIFIGQMLNERDCEYTMTISEIIKEIRKRTGVSQQMFATSLNVSIVTVNRWENERSTPTPMALAGIRTYCSEHGIDYAEFEGNAIRVGTENISLYHGSKNGISGSIKPMSRNLCDFGRGFYMGTDRLQPLTLICNFPNAKLYTVKANLENLCILNVEVSIDWALLIAYHRGKLEIVKGSQIYNKYAKMTNDCDMIIGYIANDRMFVVLDRFFSGDITDAALTQSLSALKLGKQYVALTDKACAQIEIINEEVISTEDRNQLRRQSEEYRKEGISKADEICRRYRREGRFFDEIIAGDTENK